MDAIEFHKYLLASVIQLSPSMATQISVEMCTKQMARENKANACDAFASPLRVADSCWLRADSAEH